MTQNQLPDNPLVQAIVAGMREKKATSLTLMDLRELANPLSNWFVICSGSSDRQTQAIADSVIDEVRKACKEKPLHTEGMREGEWILLDYFDVIVHVFLPPVRKFYDLEGLWADAETLEFAE